MFFPCPSRARQRLRASGVFAYGIRLPELRRARFGSDERTGIAHQPPQKQLVYLSRGGQVRRERIQARGRRRSGLRDMNVHFSSKTPEWETPQDFFDEIQKEFHLDQDVCASGENTKCVGFWSKENNGLIQNWKGMRCWMNPPYGRTIGDWVRKAAIGGGAIVVCLLPARTDTKYFHEYIYKNPKAEIRFIKGRLKFGDSKNSAPFPSCIAIFKEVK